MKACRIILCCGVLLVSCTVAKKENSATDILLFPPELVQFKPFLKNPVFAGTGTATWDKNIRERGYILKEDDGYHMWYTGYDADSSDSILLPGYAFSQDGIAWQRHPGNPIFKDSWVEDMMVIKDDSVYYMFAEGFNDIAHMLTSRDKINWTDHGSLDIRYINGTRLSSGPYGTPTVIKDKDTWYLFYERNDAGIWLARSSDLARWTNVQDEPVITRGPDSYDRYGVAVNQVIKYNGKWFAYYHSTAFEDWHEWSTSVAVSTDLVNWKKYPLNPIAKDNKSSGILVPDGSGMFNLYTMHPDVCLHFPAQ